MPLEINRGEEPDLKGGRKDGGALAIFSLRNCLMPQSATLRETALSAPHDAVGTGPRQAPRDGLENCLRCSVVNLDPHSAGGFRIVESGIGALK